MYNHWQHIGNKEQEKLWKGHKNLAALIILFGTRPQTIYGDVQVHLKGYTHMYILTYMHRKYVRYLREYLHILYKDCIM